MKSFLLVGDVLTAGGGWVSRAGSVPLCAGSVGGFTEPARMKQTFIMNKSIVIERESIDLVSLPKNLVFFHLTKHY